MENETQTIAAATVDRLAIVKAQLAELAAEEKALKETLIALGLPAVEGTLHRAAVSLTAGRTSIDWRAVAEHFNPSRQLITAHTSQGESFYTVRLSARRGV